MLPKFVARYDQPACHGCATIAQRPRIRQKGVLEISRNERERFQRGLIRPEGRAGVNDPDRWHDSRPRYRHSRRCSGRGSRVREESTPSGAEIKKEQAMKLNSAQLKRTLSQFDAEVLPDDHPAVSQLNNLFGDHTFFLDGGGLKVLEPTEAPETEPRTGQVVSLADWSDASLTSLRPHEPELTGVVIVLEFKH
jgi:hypothetical protein